MLASTSVAGVSIVWLSIDKVSYKICCYIGSVDFVNKVDGRYFADIRILIKHTFYRAHSYKHYLNIKSIAIIYINHRNHEIGHYNHYQEIVGILLIDATDFCLFL